MSARLATWLGFAALAAVAGGLHHLGVVTLVAWVPRPTGDGPVPLLLALLVLGNGVLLAVPTRHRAAALLATSLACGLVASAPFTTFGIGWALLYRRLLWSGLRPAVTLLFPIATLAALVALADAAHAPAWVTAHPALWVVSLLFASSWFLRALVVWHEARIGAPRPAAIDFLVYFLFAPFALVPPHMLALPRLALVTEGVARLDPAVQRSGLRWLTYGLALEAAYTALVAAGLVPRTHLIDALRAGDWWRVVPLAVAFYPLQVVLQACAAGALLVGLTRTFGVAIGPAFHAPLLARDLADWWRRYNTHFRDLLVDLFWYPIALRYRRRPVLAAYLGCAAVFLLGSVPLHWPRYLAAHGSPWAFPWGTLAESLVMTVLVGTTLAVEAHRRQRRLPPPAVAPWSARAWGQRALTWLAVCVTVALIGYQADYRVAVQPWERAEARAELARTAAEAAAILPVLARAVAIRPRSPARRAALARMHALAGHPAAARHQVALAHAFATAPTFANVRALARADVAIRSMSEPQERP